MLETAPNRQLVGDHPVLELTLSRQNQYRKQSVFRSMCVPELPLGRSTAEWTTAQVNWLAK